MVYCGRCNPGSDNEMGKANKRVVLKKVLPSTWHSGAKELNLSLYCSEGKRTSVPPPMSSIRTGWKSCVVTAHERVRPFPAGCPFGGAQEEQGSRADRLRGWLNTPANGHCPSDCPSCKWDKVTSLGASWETNAPLTNLLLLLFIVIANLFQRVSAWMNTLIDTPFVGMQSGFHINKIPSNAEQLLTLFKYKSWREAPGFYFVSFQYITLLQSQAIFTKKWVVSLYQVLLKRIINRL